MAKYSKKAGEKVEKTMHEMKRGKLRSGSGKKVTSREQAIAIGLSEAREAGAKVPEKKGSKRSSSRTSSHTGSGKTTKRSGVRQKGKRTTSRSKKRSTSR